MALLKHLLFLSLLSLFTSPCLAEGGVGFVLLNMIKRMGHENRTLGRSLYRCDAFEDEDVDYVVFFSPTQPADRALRLFERGSGDALSCDTNHERLRELYTEQECFGDKLEALLPFAAEQAYEFSENLRVSQSIETERQKIYFSLKDRRNSLTEAARQTYAYLGGVIGLSEAQANNNDFDGEASSCPFEFNLVIENEHRVGNSIRILRNTFTESEITNSL